MKLRIGTRGSRLALRQVDILLDYLKKARPDLDTEIVKIRTSGDVASRQTPQGTSGVGIFVKEIDRALLDGRVDVAVHSMKDLPIIREEGIATGAVLHREDSRDAVVTVGGGTLESLPAGARVGTGSGRRRAMALNARPDIEVADIRGNVDTRIEKLLNGDYDAIIVAMAGLLRLQPEGVEISAIPEDVFMPPAGQGAICAEARTGDLETLSLLGEVNHEPSRVEVEAERCFLAEVGGGCGFPVGVLARWTPPRLYLRVTVMSADGNRRADFSGDGTPEDPAGVAKNVARKFLSSDDFSEFRKQ